MQKKYLKISILLICGIMVFAGCAKKVVKQASIVNEPEVEENMPTEAPPEPEMPSNAVEDSFEVDISDWLTYRNEEYGFEIKYPEGWFTRLNDSFKNEFGRVTVDFSSYDKFYEKGMSISEIFQIGMNIYDIEQQNGLNNYNELYNSSKRNSQESKSEYCNEIECEMFFIWKRNDQRDITWDLILPVADAYILTDNYGFVFNHVSEIKPSEQKKEIEIMEEMIKTFKLIK